MKRIFFCALSLIFFNLINAQASDEYKVNKLTYLPIQSSINPAVFNYLKTNLAKMNAENGDLAIIKLNTPGGLVSTTKEIITLIGTLDIPVGVWITPEGASATSAGALIASASHILVMSPGTNIGAATPITMGKDIDQKDARAKAINDLVALVRSLSVARDRDPTSFEKMITDAESIGTKEAFEKKVIDKIINNEKEFVRFINDRKITIKGKEVLLKADLNSIVTTTKEMDPGQQLLNIFANPTTAYVLFIIGAALLYFELQAPGGFVAGALGVVFLFMAGIGFQVLPLNVGAMGLIILSFILFVLEAYITSFGILAIGGIVSLIFGSMFLYRTDDSLIELEQMVLFSVIGSIVAYVAFISWYFVKTHIKSKNRYTVANEIGHISKILGEQDSQNAYQVKVEGEIWRALSQDTFEMGEAVSIESVNEDDLVIKIKKVK